MRFREVFIQVFMESIYPLHSLAELGSFLVAAPQQQEVLPNAQLQITEYSHFYCDHLHQVNAFSEL